MSINNAEKTAEILVDAAVQAAPIVNEIQDYTIHKLLLIIIIICVGVISYLYRKKKQKETSELHVKIDGKISKEDHEKSMQTIHARLDRSSSTISESFREVKESCELKDRRLTTVETKVSDMRGSLELTVKDMIEHKTETNLRVSTLETTVNEKLMPKLEDMSEKLSILIGSLKK